MSTWRTRHSRASGRGAFSRWLKFNAVGGIGIGVQLAALWVFRSILHCDYLWATGLAVETAVIHNFIWHERFTWRDRATAGVWQSLRRLARFNTTNGFVSLAGNMVIMKLLVGRLHANYMVSNLAAVREK